MGEISSLLDPRVACVSRVYGVSCVRVRLRVRVRLWVGRVATHVLSAFVLRACIRRAYVRRRYLLHAARARSYEYFFI